MRLVMKNIFFIIVLSMVFSGCGMMGHSSSSRDSSIAQSGSGDENITSSDMNNSQTNSIQLAKDILPKNISMDFPTILKQSNSTSSQTDINDSNSSSIGYGKLKKYIIQIDDIIKVAQINLVFIKKVMPEVLDRCSGMSSCEFEAGALSIVLDKETIEEIDKIVDDKNFTAIDENLNKRVYLGELGFKREYIQNRGGYRYELKLDLSSNDKILDEFYKDGNISIELSEYRVEEYQIFKWFDYIKDVATIYLYQDSNETIDVRIYYSVDESGKESMHVLNSSKIVNIKNNMNLTLSDKDDNNKTLRLTANSIEEKILDENKSIINSFSSNGEISDESSLILFSGNIEDKNGTNIKQEQILSEVICNRNECIENNLTKELEDNLTVSDTTIEYLRKNLKFYQLKISDTNLSDGSFLILPPSTNIEDLSLIEVFKLAIGTFTILDGKAQGEIHSSEYNDVLDKLTIVRIEDNPDGGEPLFSIVEERPKIEIIDPLGGGVEAAKFYLQPQYLEYIEQFL